MKMRHHLLCGVTALLGVSLLSVPAVAQDSATADAGLGDIVVTAQKRSESVNKVGISITAVSGAELLNRGITDTSDLAKVVPGFTATPSQYNAPVYTIRGIGFYETSLAATPAVTVYTDEVPVPFPAMTKAAALDLERVEVLKGPQGTLFGQNSTGGAVNYIAAKPTATPTAGLDVGIGRFATADAQGYVSGPLSDTVRIRVAGRGQLGGDWQKNYTRDDRSGQVEQYQGRILLEWNASDALRFALNVNGFVDKGDPQAPQLIQVTPQSPATVYPYVENYPLPPHSSRAADWTPGFLFRNDKYYQTALRGELEISDALTLTSITAYEHFKTAAGNDFDALSFSTVDVVTDGKIKSFSQELRIAGDTGPVRWIVGGNYQRDKVTDNQALTVFDASTNPTFTGVTPRYTTAFNFTQQNMKTYAAFANAEIELTEGLKVQGAVRYTDARRDFAGCAAGDQDLSGTFEFLQAALNGGVFGIPSFVPIAAGECLTLTPLGATANTSFLPGVVVDELNQNNVSWKGGVNWQAAPEILLYANVSKGYKSGSYPTLSGGFTAQYVPVSQESVIAYETGIKASLFDRKAQFNAAVFYYDYKDKQFRGKFKDDIFGALDGLVNIGKSRIWGAEANLLASPVDGLTLSLGGTYVNTKITKGEGFAADGSFVSFVGNPFPYTPKVQLIGDAQYEWPVAAGLSAFVGGSVTHNSSTNSSLGNEALFNIHAYTLIDLRAGLASEANQWRFTIWGRNVGNEYYWTNVLRGQDTTMRYMGKPVSYGVTFSKKFG